MTCIFCHHIQPEAILLQTEHFKLVLDIDPIQTGHLLLISKEHYSSLTELPPALRHQLIDLEQELISALTANLPIDGVTVASNDGVFDAGTHFHVHLIPRLQNDGFWDQKLELQSFDLSNLKDALRHFE